MHAPSLRPFETLPQPGREGAGVEPGGVDGAEFGAQAAAHSGADSGAHSGAQAAAHVGADLAHSGVDLPAWAARHAGRRWLDQALVACRTDTLRTFEAWARALPTLEVPAHPCLNPPRWELGHIGWFQSWWLSRNPQWRRGLHADPEVARAPGRHRPAVAEPEALYHSSQVAHARRWALPLPSAQATQAELAAQLALTRALLAEVDDQAPDADAALYFFRLALLHEDMHHEAALYMAQALGLDLGAAQRRPAPLPEPPPALAFPACRWTLGSPAGGFAFDNELGAHTLAVAAFEIDAQVRRWADVLPFVEAGGYAEPRWWTPQGWAWRQQQGLDAPRYLARRADGWWRREGASWLPLEAALPACHLSQHEALAWCRFAGRRLPTEAEWESAACRAPGMRWGDVWEWTASAFAPYPGFAPHPYRDYSQPWFDGRPVLRGASFMTQPRMRHPRYRNYFGADRTDLAAGFRSCAV